MSAYVPNDKIQQMMNILPEYMKIKGYMCSGGPYDALHTSRP